MLVEVNISPISAYNSFSVSGSEKGKIYQLPTLSEATKARAKLIKLMKAEGFKVTNNVLETASTANAQ